MVMPSKRYFDADTVIHSFCTGCGTCSLICPTKALHSHPIAGDDGRNPTLHPTVCNHCGFCAAACPSSSIIQTGTRIILNEIRQYRLQKLVLICRNVATLAMKDKGDELQNTQDLMEDYSSLPLHELDAPEGTGVFVLRCVHRIGPRFLDKAVDHGARRILLLACPDKECSYPRKNLHRTLSTSVQMAVYKAYGIDAYLKTRHIRPSTLHEIQDIIDEFAG